jgi:hypothetical protein
LGHLAQLLVSRKAKQALHLQPEQPKLGEIASLPVWNRTQAIPSRQDALASGQRQDERAPLAVQAYQRQAALQLLKEP